MGGTKRFLQKVENDIGVQKLKHMQKVSFLKTSFKSDTLKKFRDNNGVPLSNRHAEIVNQVYV